MNENLPITVLVNADAAVAKFWHLVCPIVHLLQSQPDNLKVRRESLYMLRVRHPMDREIVLRASVTVVDDYRLASLTAQVLQCENEFTRYGAALTVMTRQLTSAEMWTDITHATSLQYLSPRGPGRLLLHQLVPAFRPWSG